jgi:putative membrane protein
MKNQQLIKSAHIWALTLLLACGLLAMAGKAGDLTQNQNQNSNSNSNSNSATQNQNSNTNTSAMGTQAGMASLSANDREFVMDAAMGGLMEVQLGRWAAQKGTSEAVKEFGKRMVDDHSQANTELMTLATSKGITLPTALDEKHQKEVAKITAMSGAGFDRAYSKKMLSDHKKDVSDFEKQSTRGTDPDIKAFAAKTLPTLQEHLQLVRTLPGNENAGGGGAGGERSTNRNMSDNSNMSGGNSNMNMNSNRNRNSNSNSNRNRNGNSNNSNRQ